MAGFQPEFAHELALDSPVAFAEGMSCIEFAEIVSRSLGKLIRAQALQVFLARQLSKRLLERGFEEIGEPEEMPALGDVHCPELAGPLVDILEDVPMDRFQVLDVEGSRRWSVDQLGNAPVRASRFEPFQLFRISEAA